MEEGFVKLYRKLGHNPVWKDLTAKAVLFWALLKADRKTGKFTTGRYLGAKENNMNPDCFRRALERLVKRYDILETKKVLLPSPQGGKHFCTEITIKNWSKYQYTEVSSPQGTRLGPQGQPTRPSPQGIATISPIQAHKSSPQGRPTLQEYIYKNKEKKIIKEKKTDNSEIDTKIGQILKHWNFRYLTHYKAIEPLRGNVDYWLKTYSLPEIHQAIDNLSADTFWADKMTPTMLFRRRNPKGEEVDYIGQLLNLKPQAVKLTAGYSKEELDRIKYPDVTRERLIAEQLQTSKSL